MSLTLYHDPISGPSRGALLAARAVGVPIKVEIIHLFQKEHLKQDFVKINPQHCVPTLVEDDLVLLESRAIASYLADKFGKDDQWYPRDLRKRALVDQRLYFDASHMYPKIRAICFPILFKGVTEITQELKDDLNVTMGYLDMFLSKNEWVAGDNATIADTSIYASVSSILAIGWDITPFPNVKKWISKCSTLPGADENDKGAKTFGDAVKKNLKQLTI